MYLVLRHHPISGGWFDPGLLHGAWWQPEGATYVNLDPGLYKAMDPDMAWSPDDILAPGGSSGH